MNSKPFIPNSTVMLTKDVLLAIGGFVEAKGHFQDFPTWTTLALQGKFGAVPRRLEYWRRHPQREVGSAVGWSVFHHRVRQGAVKKPGKTDG